MPNEPISGPCFDDLHAMCNWPVTADCILYCSCECHQEARAMTAKTEDVTSAEAQEIEATGHYVTAALCGKTLEIVPPGAWKQSWQRKLKAGDMDAFLEDVLSPDAYDTYLDLDPTNDEIGEFLNTAGEVAGESMGKSSGPRASSRSTRRR
jgi:hypothetical protein